MGQQRVSFLVQKRFLGGHLGWFLGIINYVCMYVERVFYNGNTYCLGFGLDGERASLIANCSSLHDWLHSRSLLLSSRLFCILILVVFLPLLHTNSGLGHFFFFSHSDLSYGPILTSFAIVSLLANNYLLAVCLSVSYHLNPPYAVPYLAGCLFNLILTPLKIRPNKLPPARQICSPRVGPNLIFDHLPVGIEF